MEEFEGELFKNDSWQILKFLTGMYTSHPAF